MAGLDSSFSAKRPVSVWNQPLKADFKGLFGALAKGTLHGVTGQWTEIGSDVVDTLSALGIDGRDAPQIAWLLVRRSLLSAMTELVREASPAIEKTKADIKKLSAKLDATIAQQEIAIDRSFFEKPRDLKLLAVIQGPFQEWLAGYGLEAAAAASIARRLPSYFVAALHAEWQRNPGVYEPVRDAVDTPFTRAAERERAWARYASLLERQVDEPMFGEAFGLRQVYVPLRAYYFADPSQEGKERFGGARELAPQPSPARRMVVSLADEVDAWLESDDRHDGYRVISGGPGSGKSSFARMCAARVAGEGRIPVLFIPLHQLNVTGALVHSVGEYVRLADILPANPLDPDTGEDRLLIIFDGLDELSLQGRVGADAARDFVRDVLKVVEIRNQSRRRLLVLFTGRELVIQASESELRDRHRVLHVLPYWVYKSSAWHGNSALLDEDSRQVWWRLYGEASGRGYTGLPADLRRKDLDEITAQPLLNYLVALSHSRGRLSFSQDLNLNDIYEDLLEAVHERAYERKRPYAAIQGLSLPEFRRVLEEIALAAWHGNGRTTSVGEIEAHCEAAGLSGLLKRFAEGAKAGVTRVLTAFYFRQFGRAAGGDPTFEFTHKSFREYLTALRIVRALEKMQDEIARRQNNFDSGWDDRDALRHWAEICGPSRMDWELWRFIHNEIRRKDRKLAESLQTLLCRLISSMLRGGMPMELLAPRPSYHEESRRARNAEEGLLAALNACARVTRQISHIEWPEREGEESSQVVFGAWIKRLQGQRTGAINVLALHCLSFLDLSETRLYFLDLYRADLEGARLRGAYLGGARLEEAILRGADLGGARLGGPPGRPPGGAHLRGADLEGASLEGADLRGAELEGANLEGANLEGTQLRGRDLEEAIKDRSRSGQKN